MVKRELSRTWFAFSALTLLGGHQEKHPACKNRVMGCWYGYLSGVRCRLFACGPDDATAIPKPHHLLPHLNPDFTVDRIQTPNLTLILAFVSVLVLDLQD